MAELTDGKWKQVQEDVADNIRMLKQADRTDAKRNNGNYGSNGHEKDLGLHGRCGQEKV